ncbi:expressed unknown protein [Seminavis robusta]|uniref:Uncharacterized protein n=1 Tax=Seminavis robusta TaxID=568900 RepID=A0A9N8D8V6_9STRA|nr:expressed unknown protein [Seminavis robusta]|eukprot:Sro39_g024170.1 n/a (514) ;mRNA; r:81888-83429
MTGPITESPPKQQGNHDVPKAKDLMTACSSSSIPSHQAPTSRAQPSMPSNPRRINRRKHLRKGGRNKSSRSFRSKNSYSGGSTLFHVDEDGSYADDQSKFAYSEVGADEPPKRRPSFGTSSLGDASIYTSLTNDDENNDQDDVNNNNEENAVNAVPPEQEHDVCCTDANGNPIFFDHHEDDDDTEADYDEVMSFVSALTMDSSFPRFHALPTTIDFSWPVPSDSQQVAISSTGKEQQENLGTSEKSLVSGANNKARDSIDTTDHRGNGRPKPKLLQLETDASSIRSRESRSIRRGRYGSKRHGGFSSGRSIGSLKMDASVHSYVSSIMLDKNSIRKQKLAEMDVITSSSRTTTSKTDDDTSTRSFAVDGTDEAVINVDTTTTQIVETGSSKRSFQVDPFVEEENRGGHLDRWLRLLVGCLGSEKLEAALQAVQEEKQREMRAVQEGKLQEMRALQEDKEREMRAKKDIAPSADDPNASPAQTTMETRKEQTKTTRDDMSVYSMKSAYSMTVSV